MDLRNMNITVNVTGDVVDHATAMNALNYEQSGFYSIGITYDGEGYKETLLVVDRFTDHVLLIGDSGVIADYAGVHCNELQEATKADYDEVRYTEFNPEVAHLEQDWSDSPQHKPEAVPGGIVGMDGSLLKTGTIKLNDPDKIQMQAFTVPEGHVLAPKGYVDVDLLIKVVETLQMKPKKA